MGTIASAQCFPVPCLIPWQLLQLSFMDLLPSSWCARRCTFCSNWISDDYVTSGKGNLVVVLHVLRLRAWGAWLLHTRVAGCALVAPRWDTLSVLSCWRLDTLHAPIPWDKAWVSGWERYTSLKVPGTGVGQGAGSGEPWGAPPPPPCHPMAVVGSAPPHSAVTGVLFDGFSHSDGWI